VLSTLDKPEETCSEKGLTALDQRDASAQGDVYHPSRVARG
jgi:hypothetical protein